ncbi:MAG: ArgE/DapE family deacylase [Peptoniphilaceae bacterium]|nr:ArgE/DapE family deacylase [Peptoniphilaceae bacterium]MDD7383676.1 ArgE/DapE family deacylase [Peptoniphilaceae bacterium]MDY3738773.1 ArgE/DapE family deacylase [Peptoniphilaceae bacterium]
MEKEEKVKILQDLIKIKTVNGNEEETAIYLKNLLAEHGIDCELIKFDEGRYNLVSEIKNGEGKTLALSGHMDVVDQGDESKWVYPPFEAHIENDVIWGRGASDMKSGLAALLIAYIDAKEKNNFKGTLKFIATVGEEVGELGAEQLTDLGYINGVDALIIGEPCNVGVVFAHKGSLNYKVISNGLGAHSSAPEIGINAIENLLEAMNKINDKVRKIESEYSNEILGDMTHSITIVKGGTQINSIPDHAEFEANVRTIPEFDNEKLIKEIQNILDDLNKNEKFDLKMEITANQAPVQSSPDSELVKTIMEVANSIEGLLPQNLAKVMGDVIGEDLTKNPLLSKLDSVKPMSVPGTTDGAQFIRANKDMDFAVYGPGVPMLNHRINERLPLSEYLDFIDAYIEIIKKYLN